MSLWTWGRAVADPRRTWALLGAVTLGLFVAILLACMMPLYSSLMAEGYLQHILALSSPTNVNLEITANTLCITPAVADGATKASTDAGARATSAFTTGTMTYLDSQTNPYSSKPIPIRQAKAGIRERSTSGSRTTSMNRATFSRARARKHRPHQSNSRVLLRR